MSAKFDCFVLFAEMRTGSNHLEESLATLSDVTCHGEAFNPAFIGGPKREHVLGITLPIREADPLSLLNAIRGSHPGGLPGFRFFHDHDPRVLDAVLDDPRVAKVVLTRNPLDSYVSLCIARLTGQWRLTNPKMAKAGKAVFDGAAFDAMLQRQMAFRDRLHGSLQRSGQSAFWISYDQIGDVDVLNGLAAFLGSSDRLDEVPGKLKRQNPGSVEDKVENPDEMRAHLAGMDPFLLDASVQMTPGRVASDPVLVAGADSPLLFLPVAGGPDRAVRDWLTRLDGAPPIDGLSGRDLRRWQRKAKHFTSFTVLRHPLARAHDAWLDMLAGRGPKANTLRRILTNQHGLTLPDGPDLQAHRDGFSGFLGFLKANLGGQSSLPVDPTWDTQARLLASGAEVMLPQRALREFEAQRELDRLAEDVGKSPQPFTPDAHADGPTLAEIFTPDHDAAAIEAYRPDYMQFGFKRWKNS